jgi:hypothetical protein
MWLPAKHWAPKKTTCWPHLSIVDTEPPTTTMKKVRTVLLVDSKTAPPVLEAAPTEQSVRPPVPKKITNQLERSDDESDVRFLQYLTRSCSSPTMNAYIQPQHGRDCEGLQGPERDLRVNELGGGLVSLQSDDVSTKGVFSHLQGRAGHRARCCPWPSS